MICICTQLHYKQYLSFVPAVKRTKRRKTEICRSIFDQEVNEITSLFQHLYSFSNGRVFMWKRKTFLETEASACIIYLAVKGGFKELQGL